jgi:hypothetical protein
MHGSGKLPNPLPAEPDPAVFSRITAKPMATSGLTRSPQTVGSAPHFGRQIQNQYGNWRRLSPA